MPMSDTQSQTATQPANAPATRNGAARPLRRTRRADGSHYTREAGVESQIRSLLLLSERARRERLTDRAQRTADWNDGTRLREETLVYFVREYCLRGDADAAWTLVETLMERVTLHIQRRLAHWRLTTEDAEDCARDLFGEMAEALFDTGITQEFWEVRFWVCLDRKLYNLIDRRQRVEDSEVRPGDQEADAEGERDADRLLSQLADPSARPEELAEFSAARAVLADNEWMALYLVYYLGLPEESDDPDRETAARTMGVTGRSVRNYLKRAKHKLKEWNDGA
jgi:predicted DNA-binding protein (UPF0251 family)